nr:unnamed protein product [Trichobilharzia regenti]
MKWLKCSPSKVPFFAVIHALFWLPIIYVVAVLHDHVQPIVPYVSSLGIYPPEKYIFTTSMASYGVLTIISQWFWCIMMGRRFAQKSFQSKISKMLSIMTTTMFTISGSSIIILSFIDTRSYDDIHYYLALLTFGSHAAAIPLGTLLVLLVFRPWIWFCLGRIIILLQMIIGSYFFVHFNEAGQLVEEAEDIYYIKKHEPGYEEFKWSALSEWFVVMGFLEITLITGFELRSYEKQRVNRQKMSSGEEGV